MTIVGNSVDGFEFREDADDEIVYANGVVFGPPKNGKTAGCHTAPGRVLYLNWDLKNATLYARKQEGVKGRVREPVIPRFKLDTTPIWDLMCEVARQAFDGQWDTIVSDPVSEHYGRLLREQTNNARRPTLDARGNAWTDIERWCKGMCEAPCNFIVVAHEMKADEGETTVSIPFTGSKGASQGGFGTKLKGMVDFIAYAGVVELEGEPGPKYVAQLRPGKGADGASRDAGSRFDALMSDSFREMNLAEWFTTAGVHVGATVAEAPAQQGNPTTEEAEAA